MSSLESRSFPIESVEHVELSKEQQERLDDLRAAEVEMFGENYTNTTIEAALNRA
ncbi:MAG: hypothetical protein WDZ82_03915 [Candidatus Paceibacterota bacterium]